MNDGHKGMTCERRKVGEGVEEGIFCVILQPVVSSTAPSMKTVLLNGTFANDNCIIIVLQSSFTDSTALTLKPRRTWNKVETL